MSSISFCNMCVCCRDLDMCPGIEDTALDLSGTGGELSRFLVEKYGNKILVRSRTCSRQARDLVDLSDIGQLTLIFGLYVSHGRVPFNTFAVIVPTYASAFFSPFHDEIDICIFLFHCIFSWSLTPDSCTYWQWWPKLQLLCY